MDVLDVLLERISTEREAVVQGITSGSCKNHEEYRRLVGVLEGLSMVNEHIIDIRRKLDS